jgi:ATP-dependent exoDNAse (exonuclease V) alpha subunit
VSIPREELESLRLGYAQHVYRQQGATVERSVVVTGGWQTSRESAYVQASRARQATEFFLAREELGLEGLDAGRIEKLSEKMRTSRAQLPSILYRALTPDVPEDIGEELQRSTARQLAADLARPLERKPDRDQSRGISR